MMQLKPYLSGGKTNTDPNLSLGGMPSEQIANYENLFPFLNEPNYKIYRCFYFKNLSEDTLYDLQMWTECSEGVICEIGSHFCNEIQSLKIPENLDCFKLTYTKTIGMVPFRQPTSIIKNDKNIIKNIESNLNELFLLGEICATMDKDQILINFSGKEKNRSQNILESKEAISIKLLKQGSPIKSFSTKIRFDNQKPNGIILERKPLFIGDVESGDMFYVWFSKSINENCNPTAQQIKIKTKAWIDDV